LGFRPITLRVPTLATWGLLFGAPLGAGWMLVLGVHGFLAPMRPHPSATVLVVEAWASRAHIDAVQRLVASGRYSRYVLVGGALDPLSDLARFRTTADVWAVRLRELGVAESAIEVVRLPEMARHRTAHSALASARHLGARPAGAIDLLTVGVHGRRSWRLYREALAPSTQVGLLSLQPKEYDPTRWWSSSAGVRTVVGEAIAYAFVVGPGNEVTHAREQWHELAPEQRTVPAAGETIPP
jgi:hypothetical protein